VPRHRLRLHGRCIVLWTVWRLLASASSSCTASSLPAPWARRLPALWPKSSCLRPCRRPRSRNGLDGGRAQTPLRRLLDALTQMQTQKAWAHHVHHGRPLFQLLPAACPRHPRHFDARRRWSFSLRENYSGALTRWLGTWKTATARLPPRLQRAKCPFRRESCEAIARATRKKRALAPPSTRRTPATTSIMRGSAPAPVSDCTTLVDSPFIKRTWCVGCRAGSVPWASAWRVSLSARKAHSLKPIVRIMWILL